MPGGGCSSNPCGVSPTVSCSVTPSKLIPTHPILDALTLPFYFIRLPSSASIQRTPYKSSLDPTSLLVVTGIAVPGLCTPTKRPHQLLGPLDSTAGPTAGVSPTFMFPQLWATWSAESHVVPAHSLISLIKPQLPSGPPCRAALEASSLAQPNLLPIHVALHAHPPIPIVLLVLIRADQS